MSMGWDGPRAPVICNRCQHMSFPDGGMLCNAKSPNSSHFQSQKIRGVVMDVFIDTVDSIKDLSNTRTLLIPHKTPRKSTYFFKYWHMFVTFVCYNLITIRVPGYRVPRR